MEVVNHKREHNDAEGLQAVEQHDYPEVVPGQHFGGQQQQQDFGRRRSESGSEAYMVNNRHIDQQQALLNHQHDKKSPAFSPASYGGAAGGEGDYFHGQQPVSQPLPSPGPPQYEYHDEKRGEAQREKMERRICGLTRKVFILVLVVALLVILGVALGVGLGIGLSSSSSDNKSSNSTSNATSTTGQYAALDKTGLALLSPPGSTTLYSYYIDASGMIVEAAYQNNSWDQNNTAPPSTIMNVTSLAKGSNSPIAAISYTVQGTQFRALFFFDSNGHVLTTNTTGTTAWPPPYQPSFEGGAVVASAQGTMSLAAVAGSSTTELNGIRVYLGSSEGKIQEIGIDFADGAWNKWAGFSNTDPSGGVASVITNNVNHLYLRSSAGQLQLWTWSYDQQYNTAEGGAAWTVVANSTGNNGVAQGGSIAAASDGQSTDYIFYQDANMQTVQALYTGSGSSIAAPSANVPSIQSAPVGYTLAASYSNGAVVMNQNSKSATEMLFSSVNRNGQSTGYSTQTGGSS